MALLLTLLLTAQSLAAPGVSGVVRDSSGQLLVGATVIARFVNGSEQQTVSGPDGRFALPIGAPGEVVLVVRAPSFSELKRTVPAGATAEVDIVLSPASLSETVTVTASRMEQQLGDVPASVSVLRQEDIRRSPAVVADDVLRQMPTFSLFRRTSSLASHPTAQGVSLRGIGPSGVSRTLVLLDSVPFNDPFGGWVYWTRVPLDAADRIEVVDTSSSSLYGNYAMGGVINIMTAAAMRRTLDVKAQYGNHNSPKLDFRASDVWGKLGLVLDGAAYSTDGYPIVVDVNPAGVPERGLVDKNASVEFRTFNLKGEYSATDNLRVFMRGGHFREERINAKHSTIDGTDEKNDTSWTSVNGGVRAAMGGAGEIEAALFTDFETFRSNFLAVPAANPPRSIGRMTLNQRVPSTAVGGMANWSRAFGSRQSLSVGTDWRWVDGDSEEDGLDAATGTQVTLKRNSGGTQRSIGVFVQDVISPTNELTMTFSARVDQWRNHDGHNLEAAYPSGVPTANNAPSLPERDDTVFSPRVAARYHLTSQVSVWGDIGAGFRAPTLNELYRQFRVGTVLTLANNQLGPERLVGGELGVNYMPYRNVMLRATYFDNRVEDPVSNVTLTTVGANVTQQRQNLGKTRIHGLQTDAEVRIGTSWRVTGAYLYEQARVKEFAANPALVGNFLAQVPEHRGSVQVVYSNPRFVDAAFLVQALGMQFDDDLNARTVPGLSEPGLPGYAVASFTASRAIGRNFEAFFGMQNLFDKEYFVGTLPTTIGSPRMVTGGVRVKFSGRTRQ
jgi:outer membrane receptor protein involved in Fe transport